MRFHRFLEKLLDARPKQAGSLEGWSRPLPFKWVIPSRPSHSESNTVRQRGSDWESVSWDRTCGLSKARRLCSEARIWPFRTPQRAAKVLGPLHKLWGPSQACRTDHPGAAVASGQTCQEHRGVWYPLCVWPRVQQNPTQSSERLSKIVK